MKNPTKQAFTLVEVIVVITILAILGTIAFISLEGYSKNSRDGVRIADVNSIQKNLGIYIIEKGVYPIPDDYENVTYSGATAWIEGTVGDTVIRNLDKINKKPLDPLTGNEYTYSITASKTEYQIGAIRESGQMGYKLPINQTYAATEKKVNAMIKGTYNERFLKVKSGSLNWILAVPSIITTDITQLDLATILTSKKLVYNNYSNLPHSYSDKGYTMTGGFDYTIANPLVYSGGIDTLLTNENKLIFIDNLKTAYNGTIIQGEPNYQDIINTNTGTNEIIAISLVNNYMNTNVGGIKPQNYILPTSIYTCETKPADSHATFTVGTPTQTNQPWQKTTNTNPCYYVCTDGYTGVNCNVPPITFLSNCTENSQFIYTDAIGIEIGRVSNTGTTISGNPGNLTCAGHIVVCSGTNTGHTLQACNAGATTLYTTQTLLNEARNSTINAWAGGLYQWGNNADVSYGSISTTRGDCTENSTFSQATFIHMLQEWCSVQTDNGWGNTTNNNEARIGPCAIGYHVPTNAEWGGILSAGGWGTNGTNLSKTLKMTLTGYRNRYSAGVEYQTSRAYYWSSSPRGTTAYNLYFEPSYIGSNSSSVRALGIGVRCFKN